MSEPTKREVTLIKPSKKIVEAKDRIVAYLKKNKPKTNLQLQSELGITRHNCSYGLALARQEKLVVMIREPNGKSRSVTYTHKGIKPKSNLSAFRVKPNGYAMTKPNPNLSVVADKVLAGHKDHEKAKLVSRKIKYQFPTDTPEGKLMFSVVEKAILDSVKTVPKTGLPTINANTAITYLRSDMPHAEACGVDADWVRKIINSIGIGFVLSNGQYPERAE